MRDIRELVCPLVLRQSELPQGTELEVVGTAGPKELACCLPGYGTFCVPADVLRTITPEQWADKAICAEALNLTERADFCWEQTDGQWARLR